MRVCVLSVIGIKDTVDEQFMANMESPWYRVCCEDEKQLNTSTCSNVVFCLILFMFVGETLIHMIILVYSKSYN